MARILPLNINTIKDYNNWTYSFKHENNLDIINILSEETPKDYLFIHLVESNRKKISSINGKLDGFLDEFSGIVPVTKTNSILMRSKYIGDFAHFYFNEDLFNEHNNRLKNINKFANIFKTNYTIDEDLLRKTFNQNKITFLLEFKDLGKVIYDKKICNKYSNNSILCTLN